MTLLITLAVCLIVVVILAIYLVRVKLYKYLVFLILPFILIALYQQYAYIWQDTPQIEFIRLREANTCECDTILHSCDFPLYMLEFSSDRKIEDYKECNYRIYCSSVKRDFQYNDVVYDKDKTRIESNDIFFVKAINNKFYYKAALQFMMYPDVVRSSEKNSEIRIDSITNCLHCKLFFIEMFSPIFGTSEMEIPLDSIRALIK